MRAVASFLILAISIVVSASLAEAQGGVGGQQAAATIAARTAGLTRSDGYIPFYWDQARGRLLFEITRFDQDLLYFFAVSKAAACRSAGGGARCWSTRCRSSFVTPAISKARCAAPIKARSASMRREVW